GQERHHRRHHHRRQDGGRRQRGRRRHAAEDVRGRARARRRDAGDRAGRRSDAPRAGGGGDGAGQSGRAAPSGHRHAPAVAMLAIALLALRVAVGPYVQDTRADGFTIAWETDGDAAGALEVDGRRVETRGTRHEARIDGLRPGAKYKYRVLVDGQPAAEGETSTFAEGGALSFAVFGDTRDGDVSRAIAQKIRDESPDLALFTGDLVHQGDDDAGWRTRRYYSFRAGPAEFVVLDGNEHLAEQEAWLERTLSEAERANVPHVF